MIKTEEGVGQVNVLPDYDDDWICARKKTTLNRQKQMLGKYSFHFISFRLFISIHFGEIGGGRSLIMMEIPW